MSEQKEYEEDFLKSKPTHYEYIRRLQRWRDRQEKYLDSRPRIQSLDLLSHYLTEFQYGKFDDIEVPGQYTEVNGFAYTIFQAVLSHLFRTRTATRTLFTFRDLVLSLKTVDPMVTAGRDSLSMVVTTQERRSLSSFRLDAIAVARSG